MARKNPESSLPLFSAQTWVKIILLLIVLVAGMGVQHYYVEPFISDTMQEQLGRCASEKQLLNGEINECYVKLADLNKRIV